jgi:hypothetical protein
MFSLPKTLVTDNCISVKDTAEYCGYSTQYLHRLFRLGRLADLKLGQIWLIEVESFDEYLVQAGNSADYRFDPKQSLGRDENENPSEDP